MPWRGGQPDREAALRRVWREQWEPLGLPVYLGDSEHSVFHRGASRNAAARLAGDWSAALFVDADVLLSSRSILYLALEKAEMLDVVVFPHDRYQSLDKDGRPRLTSTGPTNGGALAISREAWERVNGYDERFAGWGYEDAAFSLATQTLLGPPIRLPGYMREINHKKTLRLRVGAERVLFEEYKRAKGNRDAMFRLVREPGTE